MSQRIKFDWSLTAEELTNCKAGSALAEKLINSYGNDPDYILREDTAKIFHTMVTKNQHATPAGKGFLAKINFALAEHIRSASMH